MAVVCSFKLPWKLFHWTSVVVFVAMLYQVSAGFDGCLINYGRRGCFHQMLTGVLVTCDGEGTEVVVPHNLPQDTVYLSLTNFNFGRLRRENFTRLTAVECLSIADSNISMIDRDTFSAMESLTELAIDNADLQTEDLSFMGHPSFACSVVSVTGSSDLRNLSIDATVTLHQLRTVQLRSNNIDYISPSFFPELRHTQTLDLSDNNLKLLDWQGLNEMTQLNNLFLAANQLQTVPHYMHGVFFAVKDLTLAGNPLHCNCNLEWLRRFFEVATDKNTDVVDVSCASPRIVPLLESTPSDFHCMPPTKPVVNWTQLTPDRFEIQCSAQGDPAPTLTLTLPNGRKVISPPSPDLSKLETITPQIISTTGDLLCEASNSEGQTDTKEPVYVTLDAASLHGGATSSMPGSVYLTLMTSLALSCHLVICHLFR